MTCPPILRRAALGLSVLALASCGGEAPSPSGEVREATASAEELTPVDLDQGIGPVRDLDLGPVDPALAARGETLFTTKCSACHKLDERYVAPALGEVLSRRRPEFVMNMMLNADEMVRRHPIVRELLAEFYTPMPTQLKDPDQARAVLEYLRSAQTGAPPDPSGSTGGR